MTGATGHLLTLKENVMWFTAGMVGVVAAHRWLVPGSDVSVLVPAAIVAGANIGSYLRERWGVGTPFDERHGRILEEAMTWGFTALVVVLGAEILVGLSMTAEELFLVGGGVAVVAAGLRELSHRDVVGSLPGQGS